jgi:hypothetical protein
LSGRSIVFVSGRRGCDLLRSRFVFMLFGQSDVSQGF